MPRPSWSRSLWALARQGCPFPHLLSCWRPSRAARLQTWLSARITEVLYKGLASMELRDWSAAETSIRSVAPCFPFHAMWASLLIAICLQVVEYIEEEAWVDQ